MPRALVISLVCSPPGSVINSCLATLSRFVVSAGVAEVTGVEAAASACVVVSRLDIVGSVNCAVARGVGDAGLRRHIDKMARGADRFKGVGEFIFGHIGGPQARDIGAVYDAWGPAAT